MTLEVIGVNGNKQNEMCQKLYTFCERIISLSFVCVLLFICTYNIKVKVDLDYFECEE